tara:strand:+ start:212 stop:1807 length:1596 start_codon:yes stop_codon:yes gene_type:complete
MKNIFKDIKIPEIFRIEELHQDTFLLNGELVQWTGETLAVQSAITIENSKGSSERKVLGSIPNMQHEDALNALDAAYTAYDNGSGVWPLMKVQDRIDCVEKFVEMMKPTRFEVVKLMMWEIGKSFEDSCNEFDRTIEYIEDTIFTLYKMNKEQSVILSHKGIDGQIRRAPLGVVFGLAPYNYPLNETFCLLIPALLCGNTAVFKPGRYGVLLLFPLLKVFQKCFPKGVVNFIYGNGQVLARPILKTGKVDVLALIGNSTSANSLQNLHPKQNRLRLVLGLEAKNPAIVLSDADIDIAVKECVLGALAFNGQRCTALKILFVHDDLVEEFNKKFVQQVALLKYGLPWEEDVQITPLPELEKPQYIKELITDALKYGGNVINENGGRTIENFVFPAVVFPVNEKMKIYHEEQFGPIVPIVPFSNVSTPLDYIANSNYGQQVSLFSQRASSLAPLIDVLVNQVSRININVKCQRGPDIFPFTGRKDSAVSTLSVSDALHSFSVPTMVSMRSNDFDKTILKELIASKRSNFLSDD